MAGSLTLMATGWFAGEQLFTAETAGFNAGSEV
jgi:hypothetical protein